MTTDNQQYTAADLQAAIANEREHCAKLCEELHAEGFAGVKCFTPADCAEKIRVRGEATQPTGRKDE